MIRSEESRAPDPVVKAAPDSQPSRQEDNLESFRNLQDNLLAQDVDPRSLPLCLQFNKRDLPDALPRQVLEDQLNFRGAPSFEAVASAGEGVFETLRGISELVLRRLAAQFRDDASPRP